MDYFLYNIAGYKTNNYMNSSARKIQRAYRDHKSYEINRRMDDILYNKNKNKKEEDTDKEELEYWNLMREKIKYNSYSLKDLGWVYT